ncbi:hypothetical protein AB0A95_30965 [Micromonospora sp. NPDC049230]|uniref:hypothetical protein n=1 Tax=Micromonospora sp. NPDC049230 TaxID=3155502 RepID=UPI0033C74337
MPDLPAPQHSALLNRLVGIQPEPPPVPAEHVVDRVEHERRRLDRRRVAAERSRRRRTQAA